MSESSIIKDFKKLIGADNVLDSEADRLSYAYDSAVLPPLPADKAADPRQGRTDWPDMRLLQ